MAAAASLSKIGLVILAQPSTFFYNKNRIIRLLVPQNSGISRTNGIDFSESLFLLNA